jgi:hypothetical protein
MSSPKSYTDKAILHLEQAQAVDDPARQKEALRLALSYLRLAEMAKKNRQTDIGYGTPAIPVLQQPPMQPDDPQT